MAELLNGAPIVTPLNEKLTWKAAALKEQGFVPALAIVRVGERTDDIAYETGAMKCCEKTGVCVKRFILPADTSQPLLILNHSRKIC